MSNSAGQGAPVPETEALLQRNSRHDRRCQGASAFVVSETRQQR